MSEVKTFGADGTEVVWFAELTEDMVNHLTVDDLNELRDELSDAIFQICQSYEVNE